jgi:hypothetical protein
LITHGSTRRIGSLTLMGATCAGARAVGTDQLVHPLEMVEIRVEMIEEDGVQEHAADLRQRRPHDRGETAVRFLADSQLGAGQGVGRTLAAERLCCLRRQHAVPPR